MKTFTTSFRPEFVRAHELFVLTQPEVLKKKKKDILEQFPVTMEIGSALQSCLCIVCQGNALFPVFTGFRPLVCAEDSGTSPGKIHSSEHELLI